MTISEQIFEKLCINKNIIYKKIPKDEKHKDGSGKSDQSPDYEIIINGLKIIIEIKGLKGNTTKLKELNKNITEQLKKVRVKSLKNDKQISFRQSNTLWQPAHIKNPFHSGLKGANSQLKTDKYIKYPSIFIMYNDINNVTDCAELTDFTCQLYPEDVDNLMYNISGTCTEYVEDIKNWKDLHYTYKLGKHAIFNSTKHTQISAVGLLSARTFQNVHELIALGRIGMDWTKAIEQLNNRNKYNEIKLQIFHNIFAKNPLNVALLKTIAHEQYKNTFDVNDTLIPANLIRVDNAI